MVRPGDPASLSRASGCRVVGESERSYSSLMKYKRIMRGLRVIGRRWIGPRGKFMFRTGKRLAQLAWERAR